MKIFLLDFSFSYCGANQWTGFHMIAASVMKELKALFIAFNALKQVFFFLELKYIHILQTCWDKLLEKYSPFLVTVYVIASCYLYHVL